MRKTSNNMGRNNNSRVEFLHNTHGTIEEVGFKSLVAQSDFSFQTPKPIKIECNINEQFFGEEWVPTTDLWTPLCGCKNCGGEE